MGVFQETGDSEGFVLDPILSLRREVTVGPGKRVEVSLVIAAGGTRRQVLGMMDKYGDIHAIDRAMDIAWASAQLELRLLRIEPDEARRFQQLAGHMLFPNPLPRSLAENPPAASAKKPPSSSSAGSGISRWSVKYSRRTPIGACTG